MRPSPIAHAAHPDKMSSWKVIQVLPSNWNTTARTLYLPVHVMTKPEREETTPYMQVSKQGKYRMYETDFARPSKTTKSQSSSLASIRTQSDSM